MPKPIEYVQISKDFSQFLTEAKVALDLATTNMAYTTVQAVFLTFRQRLTPEQVLLVVNQLPIFLRALFVSDWEGAKPILGFTDYEAMNQEVRQLRADHNFSPDYSIETIASILLQHIDEAKFKLVLTQISDDAVRFWYPES